MGSVGTFIILVELITTGVKDFSKGFVGAFLDGP